MSNWNRGIPTLEEMETYLTNRVEAIEAGTWFKDKKNMDYCESCYNFGYLDVCTGEEWEIQACQECNTTTPVEI